MQGNKEARTGVPAGPVSQDEDVWDLLPDHVAVDMVLKRGTPPFHPRFVLQCLESGYWPWDDSLGKHIRPLLHLKVPASAPDGFIARVQRLLRDKLTSLSVPLTGPDAKDSLSWSAFCAMDLASTFPHLQSVKMVLISDSVAADKDNTTHLAQSLLPLSSLTSLTVSTATPVAHDATYTLALSPLSVLTGLSSLCIRVDIRISLNSDDLVALWSGLSSLQSLDIDYWIRNGPLHHLTALPHSLTRLRLRGAIFMQLSSPLSLVSSLTRLRCLHINLQFGGGDLWDAHDLAPLTNLEELYLRGSGLTMDSVDSPLPAFPRLTSLVLACGPINIRGDHVLTRLLSSCPNLQNLQLTYYPVETNEAARSIGAPSALTKLEMTYFNVSCDLVPLLSTLQSLKRLKLSVKVSTTDEAHPGLLAVTKLTALQDLELFFSHSRHITFDGQDELLERISLSLTCLKALCMRGFVDNITDTGFKHLARLPKLRELSLQSLPERPGRNISAETLATFNSRCEVSIS